MNDGGAVEDHGSEDVSALIEILSDAERRLEHLTQGQVDAVLTKDGRTFMLQRSQALLRQHEAIRQAAILDALQASVALIDGGGVILSVNASWRHFARENDLLDQAHGVGNNYLDVCDRVEGDDAAVAGRVSAGLRAVLKGESPSFSTEYACVAAGEQRWFLLMVSPLAGQPPSGAVVTHFDITERTLAQHAVQRSSDLLNAVISGTPDHVFVKDRDGRYLLCNESLARSMGRHVAEIIGRTSAELGLVDRAILSPEEAAERLEHDRRVMATGVPASNESITNGPTGLRTYQATKAPYLDEHGKVIGVIGISHDISERKEAERVLAESQALLSMASRLALVGSWYFDLPPTRICWSDALALMHDEPAGYSPTLDQALAYYAKEHRPVISSAVAECMQDGLPFDHELQILTAKGRRIWVRVIGEAVRRSDNAICRVQGALQDVSDRKRAEHQTRLLADRLTNILGSITDAFLTLDREWCFTFVNAEALRMIGRPSDNLIGSNVWEELRELAGTELQRGLRRAMQSSTGSRFEVFHAGWGGWIGVNCYPSASGLSIYVSDITQRHRDQEALRSLNADLEARVHARTAELTQAREDAEQANRAKSAFLAAMSHEIRTPMNGVVGMIDVLEQSNLKTSQAKIVQTIRESSYALLNIVDDVLDFSKIEAGHFHIDHEPMSLRGVVAQARDTLDHLAASKNVRLRLSVDERLPACVLGDAQRLRQVLLNLVGNAIKFSGIESGEGDVEIRVALTSQHGRRCTVEFVIVDDGIGMDDDTIARLFTPFMQADDTTTKRFGGTGLGLSISYRLADLMGGTIRVTSRVGEGSCFTLAMAFDWVDNTPTAAPATEDFGDSDYDAGFGLEMATAPMPLSASGSRDAGRLILVAEDNETNRDVIRQQLALMGYAVEIAANGSAALELWNGGTYALLLTDLHMPVMDGYELAATIRDAEAPGTRAPIVALTANASKGEIRRCKEVGIDAYMTKPLRLRDLHAMLEKWMPAHAQPLPLRPAKAARPRPPDVEASPDRGSAPAIDLAVLRSIVGADPNVLRKILVSFRTSAARARDAIRAGVPSGDYKAVADSAHSLKSGARSIGAAGLAEVCASLEASADSGRAADLAAQLTRFEREYLEVQRLLDISAP